MSRSILALASMLCLVSCSDSGGTTPDVGVPPEDAVDVFDAVDGPSDVVPDALGEVGPVDVSADGEAGGDADVWPVSDNVLEAVVEAAGETSGVVILDLTPATLGAETVRFEVPLGEPVQISGLAPGPYGLVAWLDVDGDGVQDGVWEGVVARDGLSVGVLGVQRAPRSPGEQIAEAVPGGGEAIVARDGALEGPLGLVVPPGLLGEQGSEAVPGGSLAAVTQDGLLVDVLGLTVPFGVRGEEVAEAVPGGGDGVVARDGLPVGLLRVVMASWEACEEVAEAVPGGGEAVVARDGLFVGVLGLVYPAEASREALRQDL